MFGGGIVWFYRKLAGMNADPEYPGYRHLIVKPMPAEDLKYAKYYNQTSYGEAGISWKKENGQFSMQVTIPVGCEATVYIPMMAGKRILEGGITIPVSNDIRFIKEEEGYSMFKVKSGNYDFLST